MERQRRRLGQWLTQEHETEARLNELQQREEWLDVKSAIIKQDIIHDATLQKDQATTKKANQERWSRIKNEYEQRDCNQRNAEGMTCVTAAMQIYAAWRSGAMKQEPVNMTYKGIRHGHFSSEGRRPLTWALTWQPMLDC